MPRLTRWMRFPRIGVKDHQEYVRIRTQHHKKKGPPFPCFELHS